MLDKLAIVQSNYVKDIISRYDTSLVWGFRFIIQPWRKRLREKTSRVLAFSESVWDRKRKTRKLQTPPPRPTENWKSPEPPESREWRARARALGSRAPAALHQLIFASGSASHAFSSGPMQTAVSVSAGSTAKMVDEAGDRFVDGIIVRVVRGISAPLARRERRRSDVSATRSPSPLRTELTSKSSRRRGAQRINL